MKTTCPCCGTTLSLDALIAHDDARVALVAVFQLSGPLGKSLVRYLALFRPAERELTLKRMAKLLNELLPDIQAQRISRHGHQHDAPVDAWIWAIEEALAARDAGRLKLSLKSHGWLYEVISTWSPLRCTPTVTDGATPAASRSQSKTLSAIGALEERARG